MNKLFAEESKLGFCCRKAIEEIKSFYDYMNPDRLSPELVIQAKDYGFSDDEIEALKVKDIDYKDNVALVATSSTPLTSYNFSDIALNKGEKLFFILIDNFRLDQWRTIKPLLSELFTFFMVMFVGILIMVMGPIMTNLGL